jgi:hypothetical protein
MLGSISDDVAAIKVRRFQRRYLFQRALACFSVHARHEKMELLEDNSQEATLDLG